MPEEDQQDLDDAESTAPSVVRLGSLAELTRGDTIGISDGNGEAGNGTLSA